MTKAAIAIAAACAASLGSLAVAHASTPSTLWWGVERILVACTDDDSLSDALRTRLCAEMVREIGRRTTLPVAPRATAERRDPEADLIVRMNASLAPERRDGRLVLVLSVRPQRHGMGGTPRPAKIVEGTFDDRGQVADLQDMIAESLEAILPVRGGLDRQSN